MAFRFRSWLFSLLAVILFVPMTVRAFSVQPSLLDVQGEAGKSVETKFVVSNTAGAPQTYYLSSIAFTPQNESGSPIFDSSDKSGAASWVQFAAPTIQVPAASKATTTFNVSIPEGTKPGGYYAAVLVSTAPADVVATAGSGANVQAKIAVLTFITVGGNGQEKVGLLDFSMKDGGSLRSGLWGTCAYRLQNQGNVHVTPGGTLRATDLFGRTMAQGSLNAGAERLMPATTRTFTNPLVSEEPHSFFDAVTKQISAFAIGPVTLRLEVAPGLTPEQPNRAELRLWIIPWQLLVCVFVGVAVLYGMMKMLMRSKK